MWRLLSFVAPCVCADHSTWPVWRHQGHRQISCRLMSACRRIQQVKGRLWSCFLLSSSFSFCISTPFRPLSLVSFTRTITLLFHCFPFYLSLCTLFAHDWISPCFLSASWLIFPLKHCRHTMHLTLSNGSNWAPHLIVLLWYPDTWATLYSLVSLIQSRILCFLKQICQIECVIIALLLHALRLKHLHV